MQKFIKKYIAKFVQKIMRNFPKKNAKIPRKKHKLCEKN